MLSRGQEHGERLVFGREGARTPLLLPFPSWPGPQLRPWPHRAPWKGWQRSLSEAGLTCLLLNIKCPIGRRNKKTKRNMKFERLRVTLAPGHARESGLRPPRSGEKGRGRLRRTRHGKESAVLHVSDLEPKRLSLKGKTCHLAAKINYDESLEPTTLSQAFPVLASPSASRWLRWARAIFKVQTTSTKNERRFLFIVLPFSSSAPLWRQRPGLVFPLNPKSLGVRKALKGHASVCRPSLAATLVLGNTGSSPLLEDVGASRACAGLVQPVLSSSVCKTYFLYKRWLKMHSWFCYLKESNNKSFHFCFFNSGF